MRRVLRWFFVVAATLFCVAMIVVWVRSYRVAMLVTFRDSPANASYNDWTLIADSGRLLATRTKWSDSRVPRVVQPHFTASERAPYGGPGYLENPIFEVAGFGLGIGDKWTIGNSGLTMQFHGISLPLWFVTMTSALIAIQFGWRIRRARYVGRNPTFCKSCGYDLRAGHDKCPECGGESHVKIAADTNATP